MDLAGAATAQCFPPGAGVAAVDSSGWDRSYASRYYTQRVKLKISSLKTTLLVDTQAQTVLDLHVTTTRKHDTQIAPRLTETLSRMQLIPQPLWNTLLQAVCYST